MNARFLARIDAPRPDVLWVATTAPVIGCIGAGFEYYAGMVHKE